MAEDQAQYPVRSVLVEGLPARAMQRLMTPRGRREIDEMEFRTVREAHEAEAALGDPTAEHICPLCHDLFLTLAFKQHAAGCIKAHGATLRANRDRELPELGDIGKRSIHIGPGMGGGEVA